MNNEHLNSTD